MIAMNALHSGVSRPLGAAIAPVSSVSPLVRAVRSVGNSAKNEIPRGDGNDLVGEDTDAHDLAYSAQASFEVAKRGFPSNLHIGSENRTPPPRPEIYSYHVCTRALSELLKRRHGEISEKLKREYQEVVGSSDCRYYLNPALPPPRVGRR